MCTLTMDTFFAHLPCTLTMHTYHPHPSPFSCHTHLYYPSDTCLNTHPNPVEHSTYNYVYNINTCLYYITYPITHLYTTTICPHMHAIYACKLCIHICSHTRHNWPTQQVKSCRMASFPATTIIVIPKATPPPLNPSFHVWAFKTCLCDLCTGQRPTCWLPWPHFLGQ